jgi:predicted nucleotidyltransferase
MRVVTYATIVRAPTEWTLPQLSERLSGALARAGAQRAVAFGSYARGTADAFSDLDLAVVLETTAPRLERPRLLDELYRAIPLPLDLLVFTPGEFEEGCRGRMDVFDRIVGEGVTVYERPSDTA